MKLKKSVINVARKRYSLNELLKGATPSNLLALRENVEWALDGKPVGRELQSHALIERNSRDD